MKKFKYITAVFLLGFFLCPFIAQADVSVVREGTNYIVQMEGSTYVIHDNGDINIQTPEENQVQIGNVSNLPDTFSFSKADTLHYKRPCAEEFQKMKEICNHEVTATCQLARIDLFNCKMLNGLGPIDLSGN